VPDEENERLEPSDNLRDNRLLHEEEIVVVGLDDEWLAVEVIPEVVDGG
jgi:hypothetical protein